MIDYSYSDLFWFAVLLISVLALFWLALREDPEIDDPAPAPTEDITKTRVIE